MAGVNVPLVAMHHAYVVTERIEGIQVLCCLYLCPLVLVLRSVRNMSCHYVNTPATTLLSYVKIITRDAPLIRSSHIAWTFINTHNALVEAE